MITRYIATAICLSLGACATQIDPGAGGVQLVTANQKETICKSLGIISINERVGPDKQSSAMNKAINEVARRGGNGLYLASSGINTFDGASVAGEAMRCTF